jgi:hypothetical protein
VTVKERTVERVLPSTEKPSTSKSQPSSPDFVAYDASLYSARVPASWPIENNEEQHKSYLESQWRNSTDANTSVLIDASEGEGLGASAKAESVRAQTRAAGDYDEVSFAPTSVSGHDAYKWVFRTAGDQRVDYFFSECGVGFAVLGSTSPETFSTHESTFSRVAESVTANCDAPPPEDSPPGDSALPPRGPSGDDGSYNCEDFDTQSQAQAYFDAAGDVDGLDRDQNGVPCEALP